MFNLIKWAYNLGVKHERRRIADALVIEAQQQRDLASSLHWDSLRANAEKEKEHADRLQKQEAIKNGIADVIFRLFEPRDGSATSSHSILFPKEENNGN